MRSTAVSGSRRAIRRRRTTTRRALRRHKRMQNLTARLLERGFSKDDTRKILGGNWLRVYRAVWGG